MNNIIAYLFWGASLEPRRKSMSKQSNKDDTIFQALISLSLFSLLVARQAGSVVSPSIIKYWATLPLLILFFLQNVLEYNRRNFLPKKQKCTCYWYCRRFLFKVVQIVGAKHATFDGKTSNKFSLLVYNKRRNNLELSSFSMTSTHARNFSFSPAS